MNQQTFFDRQEGETPFFLSRKWKWDALDNLALPASKDQVGKSALLAVLRALDSFAGNARSCFPRMGVLMNRAGLKSERHVRRTIRVLESLGYVVVELRNSRRGRVSSLYRIDWQRVAPEAFQARRIEAQNERAQRTCRPLAPADVSSGPPADMGRSPADVSSGPADVSSGPIVNRLLKRNTEPPPPPPYSNRFENAGFDARLDSEGAEAEEVESFEGLKAEDLADDAALMSAFPRIARQLGIVDGRRERVMYLALCIATDNERKSKAGTDDAFRSFRGVLNYRLQSPRIEWRNWVTMTAHEKAERLVPSENAEATKGAREL